MIARIACHGVDPGRWSRGEFARQAAARSPLNTEALGAASAWCESSIECVGRRIRVRLEDGTMIVARLNRPIMSLLALALAATSLPAAAQSGSEAVVCVGSETRTLATNPIRRVYTEDMEVVYRTGVDIGQRAQIERTLSSELGSYPEVWCAWSDPGDDHAAIVGYTGVIRQDLTVDLEDLRFQAFSVGFGTSFDEADTQATTINQRFSSQIDGSGKKAGEAPSDIRPMDTT